MTFLPLNGVRILDLTSVVVGPAATLRLGHYGADVIKVESPAGDLMRGLGGMSPTGQHSGAYLHLNRNKRNVCLDLKQPGAREAAQRLAASCSIVIANMRPDALVRLQLDAETIRARNPSIIYCMLTGYGTDGPYSGLPTYDSVVQGVSGIAGLTLIRDGAPSYVPLLICDHVVGEIAAGAVLAAVLERQRTGTGALIEVPMFETMAAFVMQEHLAQRSFDPPVGPAGDQRLLSPHNRPVRTGNGYISITINTDDQVRSFLVATDRASLADDARFNSVAARAQNVGEWFEIRGADLLARSTEEWLDVFRTADLAAMPCHTLDSLTTDLHLRAVELVGHEQHPSEGRTAAIRPSILIDGERMPAGSPAGPKGWDTQEVLQGVGYTEVEIAQLVLDGAAYVSARH
jgi:crotonobetainyl-CoA:carnitine CoA-transferase CaiB-like acyl-CoA transferase